MQGDRVSVFKTKKPPILEVDIADILEVVRDDKEIERTMLGPGMTIAEKTTDLRATGKSNESRIAFELRSEHATEQRRVYLFETRLPGIEIDDWYAGPVYRFMLQTGIDIRRSWSMFNRGAAFVRCPMGKTIGFQPTRSPRVEGRVRIRAVSVLADL